MHKYKRNIHWAITIAFVFMQLILSRTVYATPTPTPRWGHCEISLLPGDLNTVHKAATFNRRMNAKIDESIKKGWLGLPRYLIDSYKLERFSKEYSNAIAEALNNEGYRVKTEKNTVENPKLWGFWYVELLSSNGAHRGDWIIDVLRQYGWRVFIDPTLKNYSGVSITADKTILISPTAWGDHLNGVRWVLFHEARHALKAIRNEQGLYDVYDGHLLAIGKHSYVVKDDLYKDYLSFHELWTYQQDLNAYLSAIENIDSPAVNLFDATRRSAESLKKFSKSILHALDKIEKRLLDNDIIFDPKKFFVGECDLSACGVRINIPLITHEDKILTVASFRIKNQDGELPSPEQALERLQERMILLRARAEDHLRNALAAQHHLHVQKRKR